MSVLDSQSTRTAGFNQKVSASKDLPSAHSTHLYGSPPDCILSSNSRDTLDSIEQYDVTTSHTSAHDSMTLTDRIYWNTSLEVKKCDCTPSFTYEICTNTSSSVSHHQIIYSTVLLKLITSFNNNLAYLKSSDLESYQKKLNITPPQQTFPKIKFKKLYTPSHNPLGVIYEDLTKQKRVMRADEMYKFSDGTLKKVWNELHHRIRDFRLEYNMKMLRRKWTTIDRKWSELMVELIDKQMCKRRIIQNLEKFVGARELEMDYKLMTRYVRLDNQSIERDRLNGIGFVLDFVEFISFTFSDKEMIFVIEVVSR
ncbi:hypothetical protein Tco_0932153 [Tanacetum coccineum]